MFLSPETFNMLLVVMSVVALAVFVALYFVEAGYGMLFNRKFGFPVPNRIGWVLMESPVFIAMTVLWLMSDRTLESTPLVIFCLFQLHYFQRSFIFPLIMRGNSKMPAGIVAMGMAFNLMNAVMQGGWIFYLAPAGMYSPAWLCTPQFIAGTAIFFCGMFINLHSDYIIRHLRAPGDRKHYIPRGGMFRWVSSANYFGELVEWTGFAILTWSAAGAVFAWWTFANLVPRSDALYRRYAAEFGREFTDLKRKRIIPYIY